jgi:hypothetical protein
MVLRNALRILKSRLGGRPRTPLGCRVTLVNEKNVHYRPGEGKSHVEKYYEYENAVVPYQMYYPGVDGLWPLHRWRLLWTWIFDRKAGSGGRCPDGCNPGRPIVPTLTSGTAPGYRECPAPAATTSSSAAPAGPCRWIPT